MTSLNYALTELNEFNETASRLKAGRGPVSLVGLSTGARAHMLSALYEGLGLPVIMLTSDEPGAVRLSEDINALMGSETSLYYPSKEWNLRDVEGLSHEYEQQRVKALHRLVGEGAIIVASVEAALQLTLPPDILKAACFRLTDSFDGGPDGLIKLLHAAGYTRADQVEGFCQYARRGGIVDFFTPSAEEPFRVEFWGDDIDSLSSFSPHSQRRTAAAGEAEILPGRELLYTEQGLMDILAAHLSTLKGQSPAKEQIEKDITRLKESRGLPGADRYFPLIYPGGETLLSYAKGNVLLAVGDYASCRENMKALSFQRQEDTKVFYEQGLCSPGCDSYDAPFEALAPKLGGRGLLLDAFARAMPDISLGGLYNLQVIQPSAWGGELSLLTEQLEDYRQRGYCVSILAATDRAARSLQSDLSAAGFAASLKDDITALVPGAVFISRHRLSGGLEYPSIKYAVISHQKSSSPPRKTRRRAEDAIRSISDLVVGDYVVHVAHGIGVYAGLEKQVVENITKDYIKIRYSGSDTLFVPVTSLDLVSRYVGKTEDGKVRLNKLSSPEWSKTRARVRAAVADMAKELMEIYAKRAAAVGHAFSEDSEWQRDFESRFAYEETDDQLRSTDEIKADMQSAQPMDRLLCGDVGFGKTEVALRAMFKCVMDDKQCALLVPTTLLAYQHYQTCLERMQGFPIRVELLSRFVPKKQQEQIIKDIKRGLVDVVIGTHRILQKDIDFRRLGLVVIDEEQRFGVAHKERFKQLRSEVDILTLSATPIPRTLGMAMAGIRDISLIEEPPQNRHPVQTYVLEHDWNVLAEAIKRELRRGGQVFFLHNRIDNIELHAARIAELVPEARVRTAHGRMDEGRMAEIWQGLLNQEIDVLVCTTIIEAGVDVTNCNTLIVEEADRFGLSQLYQIRGRVGRGSRRAFAYLTFRRDRVISEIAQKRLEAIREFTSFGSGLQIAMRDLEIRGAGNILGAQQHGHMDAVGYEMYLRLLSEAVAEARGEPLPDSGECLVDVQITAHIPEDYIESQSQRLDIYKKIAAIRSDEDARDMTDELIDRFGEPPQSVMGLIEIAELRGLAGRVGIREIGQRQHQLMLYPARLTPEQTARMVGALGRRVLVNAGAKPYYAVKFSPGTALTAAMREALGALLAE